MIPSPLECHSSALPNELIPHKQITFKAGCKILFTTLYQDTVSWSVQPHHIRIITSVNQILQNAALKARNYKLIYQFLDTFEPKSQ